MRPGPRLRLSWELGSEQTGRTFVNGEFLGHDGVSYDMFDKTIYKSKSRATNVQEAKGKEKRKVRADGDNKAATASWQRCRRPTLQQESQVSDARPADSAYHSVARPSHPAVIRCKPLSTCAVGR